MADFDKNEIAKMRRSYGEQGLVEDDLVEGDLDSDPLKLFGRWLKEASENPIVVEANAMGTPAVVYPVHGLTESTLHNVTGWVAESETPQALCASILALRDNDPEYQSARLQAWDRAKTLHWSQVLPRACQWLEEQAKQKKYL